MLAMGNDSVIAAACAAGSLELNAFLPLIAHCLLENLDLLARADDLLRGSASMESRPTRRAAARTWRTRPPRPRRWCRALGYERGGRGGAAGARAGQDIREVVVKRAG